ncbi:hypothetical protein BH11MYX1_BH11MYX1_36780 [soil metagenome]
MTRFFVGFILVVALQAPAGAQGVNPNLTIGSFDPDDAIAPNSIVEGHGVKIGEGTVLHPVFGVETGFVSNVFYTANNAQGAALLRLIAQIGTSSLPDSRLLQQSGDESNQENKGGFQYRANLRASYDVLYANNSTVANTGGLGVGASLHGIANPMGRFSFGIDDDFSRLIRAANFETDANTNRDINTLGLNLLYHPQDHSIGGYLYYVNTIDVFESNAQGFANRMFNKLGVHPTWQWLPRTQVYADLSESIVTTIGTTPAGIPPKATSYPFSVLAGLSTLFTIKTTFNVFAGYTNGFYSSGPSFSAPQLGAQLGYRYSPLGRITLLYSLLYQDSINANYYRDHVLQVSLQQAFDPLVFMVQPEVHFREYSGVYVVNGPPNRNDVIFSLVAGAHYNFRDWISATLDYRFSTVQTDYRYMPIGGGVTTDPSYARHELLLGVRAAL